MQSSQEKSRQKIIHGSSIDYQDRRKRLRQLPPSPPPGLNPFHAPTINALEGMFERVMALASASNKSNSSTSTWLSKSQKNTQGSNNITTSHSLDVKYSSKSHPPSHSPAIWPTISEPLLLNTNESQNPYRYMIPPTTEVTLDKNAIQKNSSLDILSRQLLPQPQQEPAVKETFPSVNIFNNAPVIAAPAINASVTAPLQKKPHSPEPDDDVVELLSSDEDENDESVDNQAHYKFADEDEDEFQEDEDYDGISEEDNQEYSDDDEDYEDNADQEDQDVRPRPTDHNQNAAIVLNLEDSDEEQEDEEELQDEEDDDERYDEESNEGSYSDNVEPSLGTLHGQQFGQGQVWNESVGLGKPIFQDPNLLFQYANNLVGSRHLPRSEAIGEDTEGDCIDEAIIERDQSASYNSDIEAGYSEPTSEISRINDENIRSGSYGPSSDDVVLLESDDEETNGISQSDPASSEFYDKEGSEEEIYDDEVEEGEEEVDELEEGEEEVDELEEGGVEEILEDEEEVELEVEDEIEIEMEEQVEADGPRFDLGFFARKPQGDVSDELEMGTRNEVTTTNEIDIEVEDNIIQYDTTEFTGTSIAEFQAKDDAISLNPVATSFDLQTDSSIGQFTSPESHAGNIPSIKGTNEDLRDFSSDHISLLERLRSVARETNIDLIPREISPDMDLNNFPSLKTDRVPVQPILMPESQNVSESLASTNPAVQSQEDASNAPKLSQSSPRKARLTRTSTMARTVKDGLAFIENSDLKSNIDGRKPTINTHNVLTDETPLSPTASISDVVSESGSSNSGNVRHRNEVWLLVEEARAFCSGLPRTTPGSSTSTSTPTSHLASPTKKLAAMDTIAPLPVKPQFVGSSPSKSSSNARRRISFGENQDSLSENPDQPISAFSVTSPAGIHTGIVDLAAENVIQSTIVGNHALRSLKSSSSPVSTSGHVPLSGSRSNSQEPNPAPHGTPSQPITNPFTFGQIPFGGPSEGKILGFNNSFGGNSNNNSNSGNSNNNSNGVGFSFGMSFVTTDKDSSLEPSHSQQEVNSDDPPVTSNKGNEN